MDEAPDVTVPQASEEFMDYLRRLVEDHGQIDLVQYDWPPRTQQPRLLSSGRNYWCWGCGCCFEGWQTAPEIWEPVMRPYDDPAGSGPWGAPDAASGLICVECFRRIAYGDEELGFLQALVGLEIRRRLWIDSMAKMVNLLPIAGQPSDDDALLVTMAMANIAQTAQQVDILWTVPRDLPAWFYHINILPKVTHAKDPGVGGAHHHGA